MDTYAAHRIICQDWLDRARIDLTRVGRDIHANHRKDFSNALGDRRLIADLEQQLFGLVSECVVADMWELESSRLLYRKTLKTPHEVAIREYVHRGTPPAKATDKFRAVSHEKAYRHYLDRILAARGGREDRETHMAAFLSRFPRLTSLLDIKSRNFTGNIREAATRLAVDWSIVNEYFFRSADLVLSRIIGTGNDSHKSGRQVLILEFSPASRPSSRATTTHRLVYKPSDVEIDYAVVGENGPELQKLIKKTKTSRLPEFRPSFFQLINAALVKDSAKHGALGRSPDAPDISLPTYRVLPMQPGSKLRRTTPIPLHDSYGYIEYLSHEPLDHAGREVEAGARERFLTDLLRRAPKSLDASDMVAQTDREVKAFYRVWGRLIAATFIVQATDLHQENQIVHEKRPHLIDLENTMVKALDDTSGSMIPAYLAKSESLDPTKLYQISGLTAHTFLPLTWYQGKSGPYKSKATKNQLYHQIPVTPGSKKYRISRTNATFYWESIERGIVETFESIRQHASTIEAWIKHASNAKLIVRHVPIPTQEYYHRLGEYISTALDSGVDDARILKTLENIKKRTNDQNKEPLSLTESEKHSWRDYRNLDIPSYYRSIADRHLLNARGEKVTPPRRSTAYFSATGTALYSKALKRCRVRSKDGFQGFIEAQVHSAHEALMTALRALGPRS